MAQNVKTVQGVAIASVKTVQGVAIANVKTIQGVDNTGGGSDPWITSNPATSWRNNFDGGVGSNFTTDGTSRTITDLGLYVRSGSTATVEVKVINGLSVVTSASFNQTGMPAGWNYISVTPVALPASTSMVIARQTVNGLSGDDWPDDWAPTTSGIMSSFNSVYATAFVNDESQYTPLSANSMLGGVDFKYTTP